MSSLRSLFRRAFTAIGIAAVVATTVGATAEPAPAQNDSFTIVVIPDTQKYVEVAGLASVFEAQTQWIADGGAGDDVVFVTHVGDVVQNPGVAAEWDRADVAFATLEATGLSWGVAAGNHDLLPIIAPSAPYDERFPASRFEALPTFGGGYPSGMTRLSHHTLEAGGHRLLFIHIRHLIPEINDDLLLETANTWVADVLAAHPNHLAFVTTHEFTRTDGSIGPAGSQDLRDVLAASCQVAMVFSGHRTGTTTASFDDDCGRTVPHVLTNFQASIDFDQGFLRTIRVDAATLDATSRVYSPVTGVDLTGTSESFTTPLAAPAFVETMGDVDCNTTISLLDARVVAQLAIAALTDSGTCAAAVDGVSAPAALADVNDDGTASLIDARLIAQCAIGTPNVLCPVADG